MAVSMAVLAQQHPTVPVKGTSLTVWVAALALLLHESSLFERGERLGDPLPA
jgi:hypothetical protein